MSSIGIPQWLAWGREIQALAQTGAQYAANDYERERYARLRAIAAEIISEHTVLDFDSLDAAFAHQIGYATPRVDVRGAVFREGQLLFVRERADGGWTLPGGWADVGDMPSGAVEREVLEESGFQVQASRLIGVYDANRLGQLEVFHAFKLVFLCELEGGDARVSSETTAVDFFGPDNLPVRLSGERTTARHIRDAFIAWQDPSIPAIFD